MAENKLTISDLELAQDLAPDMVTPVETSSDTKSTTLGLLQKWLEGFFINKTTYEEIKVKKTFDSIDFRNPTLDISTPTAGSINLGFRDKRTDIGNIQRYHAGKNESLALLIYDKNTQRVGDLGINYNGEYNFAYGVAPTPNAYAIGREILTAKWLLDNGGYVKGKSIDGIRGYIQYSSGLKIQWGRSSAHTGTTRTITLPSPFLDTNYLIIPTCNADAGSWANYGVNSSTQFTLNTNNEGWNIGWIALGKGQ